MYFFISKFLFRFVTLVRTLLNQFRLQYYVHLYEQRLVIDVPVEFGALSTIVFYPGAHKAKISISKLCVFRRGCILSVEGEGHISIGENSFFNNNCSLTSIGSILIGKNNLFGEGVKIYDHNHVYIDLNEPIQNQGFQIGNIIIGNNCWIGSNCIILNNVTIGDNVIIGANNLVYKSIPANTIVKSNQNSTLINR